MKSKFTGGVFALFFYRVLVVVFSSITLGFGYPFIICRYLKWEADHTYINDLKLQFNGKAAQLFKKYVVWMALCVITFGIYYIIRMQFNIIKWKTENTHIAGREEKQSYFDGKCYQLLGVIVLKNLITCITLGIGYAWAYCGYRDWICSHTYIDGNELEFAGTGREYFFKYLGWGLLTVITLGIYGFWFNSNIVRMTTARISFRFKEEVVAGKTVLVKYPVPVLPKSVEAVSKPVMGPHFKRIFEFSMVKRAMLCFVCEIPVVVAVSIIMAFTVGFLAFIIAPIILWLMVLLSLPAIFLVEEQFENVDEIHLDRAFALSITGVVFSTAIPIFLPVFIYGLVETVRLKELIYEDRKISKNSSVTEYGKAIIAEQETYFVMAKKYQSYIWDCSNYKKAVKKYAKDVIAYKEKDKQCQDALEMLRSRRQNKC